MHWRKIRKFSSKKSKKEVPPHSWRETSHVHDYYRKPSEPQFSLLGYLQNSHSAFANISKRVCYEWVEACLRDRHFYDHSTTGRYRNGLVANLVIGRISISIRIAEKSADYMEGRKLRWTRIHNKDTNTLTCLRCYRIRLILVHVAVKHHIVRNPVVHLSRVYSIGPI